MEGEREGVEGEREGVEGERGGTGTIPVVPVPEGTFLFDCLID